MEYELILTHAPGEAFLLKGWRVIAEYCHHHARPQLLSYQVLSHLNPYCHQLPTLYEEMHASGLDRAEVVKFLNSYSQACREVVEGKVENGVPGATGKDSQQEEQPANR